MTKLQVRKARSMRGTILSVFTIILSALTLISEYPSYVQCQKEEETDLDQLQVEEADVRINDPNLKLELVSSGLTGPTNMAFSGQHDILVLETGKGTLRRMISGFLLPEPLLSIDPPQSLESFMCGIAIAKNNNNPIFSYTLRNGREGKNLEIDFVDTNDK